MATFINIKTEPSQINPVELILWQFGNCQDATLLCRVIMCKQLSNSHPNKFKCFCKFTKPQVANLSDDAS